MGNTEQAQGGSRFNGAAELHLKTRNPVIAFFLSVFFPGLGQLYNGEMKKFAAVLAFSFTWCLAMIFYDPFSNFRSAVVYFGLSLLFPILIAGEAAFSAGRLKAIELKKYNRVWVYIAAAIVPALLLSLIPSTYDNYNSFNVSASSMEPALRIGERIMVQRTADKSVLSRGDIIIFRIFRAGSDEKQGAGKGKFWLKRIVGLPGETLEIRNRVLFINGLPLEEFSYKVDNADAPLVPKMDNLDPLKIPADSYFVLGDAFLDSFDSRFFGAVPAANIAGKAIYIVWSNDWDRFGKNLDKDKP